MIRIKVLVLGTFFTYTMYGFKRAPFTYQHRIGYNYFERVSCMQVSSLIMMAGDVLYLNASISSPRNFENFFGFGNNTAGYKEEKKEL